MFRRFRSQFRCPNQVMKYKMNKMNVYAFPWDSVNICNRSIFSRIKMYERIILNINVCCRNF